MERCLRQLCSTSNRHENGCVGACMHRYMDEQIDTWVHVYVKYTLRDIDTSIHRFRNASPWSFIGMNLFNRYLSIYIYIYIHTYNHTYIERERRIYVYIYIYVYIHIYIYIYLFNDCYVGMILLKLSPTGMHHHPSRTDSESAMYRGI